jgi:hypothetical protein
MLRFLCVAENPQLIFGISQTFAGPDIQISAIGRPDDLELLNQQGKWDVLILDLEVFHADPKDTEFLSLCALRNARIMVAVVPSRCAAAETKLRERDVIVLHSPAAIGEIVLGLNRALRELRK